MAIVRGAKIGSSPAIRSADDGSSAISPLASCPRLALGSQIRPFHRSPRARDWPSARKSGHFTARLVPATGPRLANPAISPLASCLRPALGSQIHNPNRLALGPLDLAKPAEPALGAEAPARAEPAAPGAGHHAPAPPPRLAPH